MKVALYLLAAAAGVALGVHGIRLATTRGRPHNLGGMVLATVGVGLALSSLAAAAWWLGR